MSFKRKQRIYKLDFEGTEYDGLVVKVRGLTTGEYLDLVSLSAASDEGDGETEGMIKLLSTHLVSWNLEDEETDEPVPTTYEGLRSNDIRMNMVIVNAWTTALTSV